MRGVGGDVTSFVRELACKGACIPSKVACVPVEMTFLEHICALLTRECGSRPAHPPGEAPSQKEPEGLKPLCSFPLDSLGAD